jgi:hypothetical protein
LFVQDQIRVTILTLDDLCTQRPHADFKRRVPYLHLTDVLTIQWHARTETAGGDTNYRDLQVGHYLTHLRINRTVLIEDHPDLHWYIGPSRRTKS